MKIVRIFKIVFLVIIVSAICFVSASHSIAADISNVSVATNKISEINTSIPGMNFYILKGSLTNEEGISVTVGFEYWCDEEDKYPSISCGKYSESADFSVSIPYLLLEEETYYYRAYYVYSNTKYYGTTRSFITPEFEDACEIEKVDCSSIPVISDVTLADSSNIALLNSLVTNNREALDIIIGDEVIGLEGEATESKFLYQTFIENYYNDPMLRYSLNVFDALVYNREELITDFVFRVPRDVVYSVSPTTIDTALAGALHDITYKRYNTALNTVLGQDYKSSHYNTFAYDQGIYSQYAGIVDMMSGFNKVTKEAEQWMEYLDTANKLDMEYCVDTLIPTARDALIDMCNSYKVVESYNRIGSQSSEYFDYLRFYHNSRKDWIKHSSVLSEYQDVNEIISSSFFKNSLKILNGMNFALDYSKTSMIRASTLEMLQKNQRSTLDVFKRISENAPDDNAFKRVLETLIAGAENQEGQYIADNVNSVFGALSSYTTLPDIINIDSVSSNIASKVGRKALSTYNKIGLAADLTGEITQAISNTEDLLNYAIEIKYLYRIENYTRATLNCDVADYSSSPSEETASRVINDLYFLKAIRLYANKLAKNYFVTQESSLLHNAFGFVFGDNVSEGINNLYNQQLDAIVDRPLTESKFTTEPLVISSDENIDTANSQAWARRISGGIEIKSGTVTLNIGDGHFFVPYIRCSGGTLVISGSGVLETDSISVRSEGNLIITKDSKLYVSGDVSANGTSTAKNYITLEGMMEVGGNFHISSDSYLVMKDKEAYLLVKGNASIYEAESQISAGTIEVKGDESRIYTDISDASTATVILSGDVQQFVNGQYKNLIVNNSGKGIQCYSRGSYHLYVYGDFDCDSPILNGNYFYPQGNARILKDVQGSITFKNNYTPQQDLVVTETVYLDDILLDTSKYEYSFGDISCKNTNTITGTRMLETGNLYVGEGTLTISETILNAGSISVRNKGNLIITKDSKLYVSGDVSANGTSTAKNYITLEGMMEVGGNFHISSDSYLVMKDKDAYLLVKGNASIYEAESQISAGTIEVKGDANIYVSTAETSTSTVILNGERVQSVKGKYCILVLDNSTGVNFNGTSSINKLFNHNQNTFTTGNYNVTFVDYDGDMLLDNADPYPLVGNPCRIELVSNNEENGSVSEPIDTIGGTTVTVSAYENTNSYFVCWQNSDGETLSADQEYTFVAKGDITLTAVFFDLIFDDPGEVYVGSSVQLTATISPSSEADTPIVWSSSDTRIATVDENGVLTPKTMGRTKITVSTADGKCSSSRYVWVKPTDARITIRNLNGSNEQKIDWWKSYSSATMNLSVQKYNCGDVAYYKWTSSNKRVKVNERGVVTNTGHFSRSATLTLTAYDEDGNVITKSSIKVAFYKFKWQKNRLQTQSIVSDNYLDRNVSEKILDTTTENEFVSFFSYIYELLEKVFKTLIVVK